MDLKQKNLIIITEVYPYEGGEQFLYNEFIELSKQYKNLYIFPLNKKDKIVKNLPNNIIINNALTQKTNHSKLNLFKNLGFVFLLIFTELFTNKNSKYFLLKLKYNLATISQAIGMQTLFKFELEKLNLSNSDTYSSTWMNLGSLILSISKYKKVINKFFFRVNGFDIFDDRRLGNYMPFQAINYKLASHIIILSEAGLSHISKKNIYPNKLSVNYSGLYDRGVSILNENSEFTIVSCSGLVKLKRVELIANSLANIKSKLTWIHFGDGPEMENIKVICDELPKNISVNLKGNTPNEDIINFYKSNSVNLFIHVSETEGLGMATIEAQSFGIPAISCDVGGVPEVVTNLSGELLSKDITAKELATKIANFKNSKMNTLEFREKTRTNFLNKFNIKKNIITFIDTIESNEH